MGHQVFGIGHKSFSSDLHHPTNYKISSVTLESLQSLNICPDIVFHCASGSSVPASFESPYSDFSKTVDSTYAVINYILECCPSTSLVMPSSAAVYGASNGTPLSITSSSSPVSPYGLHKKFSEDLLIYYSKFFGINSSIVRFSHVWSWFAAALWDASLKFRSNCFEFYGTGNEIRDWIYIDDAINLLYASCKAASVIVLFVMEPLGYQLLQIYSYLLAQAYKQPEFTHFSSRVGDPSCYLADISSSLSIG